MEKLHSFYYFLESAGTFAFAISGAVAARQRGLDLFGICALAFTVACGGGIIRDICIGAIPPAGVTKLAISGISNRGGGINSGTIFCSKAAKPPRIIFRCGWIIFFCSNRRPESWEPAIIFS